MKMVLLLFAQSSVEKGLADPSALCELLNQQGSVAAEWSYFDDLVYHVTDELVALYNHRTQKQITDYAVVYFRYWGAQEGHAIAAARICKLLGVPFIDDEVLRRGSQNKLTQYVNLHEIGVSIPDSLMATGELLQQYYASYDFDFPFIMKDKGGTRGQNNYLVRSLPDMQSVVAQHPGVTFVLQQFIPNTGDYRVLVMGDAVKLVIERTADGDSHLNNTSQGGSARIVPNDSLPQQVLDDCVKASQFYGRNVTGVDIVRASDSGKYYCFEVNRAPQIEHASFEQQKAALLADYLASLA